MSPEYTHQTLIVTDDHLLYTDLKQSLPEGSFNIFHFAKFSDALYQYESLSPDFVICDSRKNELQAFEFCFHIKSLSSAVATVAIILSDSNEEFSEIAAFDSGATDFVRFPLRTKALAKRMLSHLKFSNNTITLKKNISSQNTLKIDRESYSVFKGNENIRMSRKEFELLYFMASHPGKLFKRNELYTSIWKKNFNPSDRTIDVHILRLRKKLGQEFISTQKGLGYRLMI